eukprot:2659267-Alexandrium_andersonii.AAC.1
MGRGRHRPDGVPLQHQGLEEQVADRRGRGHAVDRGPADVRVPREHRQEPHGPRHLERLRRHVVLCLR